MSTDTQEHCMPAGPGAEHQRLHDFVGTWKATVTMWMGPGEPMVSTGTMVNTMELDGRYLREEYKGDPNDGPFPAFMGKGYWGFNDARGVYEGFWIDNASNQMGVERGDFDPGTKSWEMKGETVMPGMGAAEKRSVITLVSKNEHTMEMYFTGPDGHEVRCMHIKYVRA